VVLPFNMSAFEPITLVLDKGGVKEGVKEGVRKVVQDLEIVIVEKLGTLKSLKVKDFKEEELYKKCGFKKVGAFSKKAEWVTKIDKVKYTTLLYATEEGSTENKYDFPPPADNKLFFGNCAIVCKTTPLGTYTNLPVKLWTRIWEKLFGGFEDLSLTCMEDDAEIDELDAIPASKKTKQGYLKDGFVVDSGDSSHDGSDSEEDDDAEEVTASDEEDVVENLFAGGSELSEEEYDYSD
jgi:hypothetical protein